MRHGAWRFSFIFTAAAALVLTQPASAQDANRPPARRNAVELRIEEIIQMLRASSDADSRTGFAAQLAEFVAAQRTEAARIDAQVVDDMATLLSDGDDWVRFYGAASLGFVGPAARRAIPALEKALEQSRETMALNAGQTSVFGALSSAGAICTAFTRIDLSRVPAGCEAHR